MIDKRNQEIDGMLDEAVFRSEPPGSFREEVMASIRRAESTSQFRLPLLRMSLAAAVFCAAVAIALPHLSSTPGPGSTLADEELIEAQAPPAHLRPEEARALDGLTEKALARLQWLVEEDGGRKTLIREQDRLTHFGGRVTAEISDAIFKVGEKSVELAGTLTDLPRPVTAGGSNTNSSPKPERAQRVPDNPGSREAITF